MAVNAGAGLVPVGPTEMKKGRVVATVFENPSIAPNPNKVVYQTHTHELWITGTGFTRGAYSTRVDFDPPLLFGVDYVMMVFNRTHALVSLMDGRKWAPGTGILRVIGIDTGAGAYKDFKPVAVAHVAVDADDHPSGLTPPLALNSDYKITRAQAPAHAEPPEAQEVALRGRALYLTALKCGSDAIELAYGQGIVVATVLADPTIEMSERKIYATHTKRLIVQGSGFSLDGTELTLRPTSRAPYEVESVEMAEMVLLLKDGKSWAPLGESSSPVSVYVTKVDTGAGEVVMEDDGAVIARWANDGYCDDTRTSGLCDLGTDCHDCGPASEGNFTTWDDDGWWDDDENYWDDDYDFENYGARRRAPPGSRTSSTRATSSFELLAPPSAEDELEMAKSAGRAAVPITPDVAYTGK
ncbi:hypothetical protein JL722_15228 [Aureococcus anophagefferens]|nr:hypothetical protein JL722_15228 [Aureococcus anophagefferens]